MHIIKWYLHSRFKMVLLFHGKWLSQTLLMDKLIYNLNLLILFLEFNISYFRVDFVKFNFLQTFNIHVKSLVDETNCFLYKSFEIRTLSTWVGRKFNLLKKIHDQLSYTDFFSYLYLNLFFLKYWKNIIMI